MAVKRMTYVEPKGYFSPEMKKAAEKWEKENAAKQKQASKTGTKKK